MLDSLSRPSTDIWGGFTSLGRCVTVFERLSCVQGHRPNVAELFIGHCDSNIRYVKKDLLSKSYVTPVYIESPSSLLARQ